MRARRKRQTEEAVSQDRWLVSYADFITLLFALFVVLFASVTHGHVPIGQLAHAIRNGFHTSGEIPADGAEGAQQAPHPPVASAARSAGLNAMEVSGLRNQLEAAMGPELRDHEIQLRTTPEGFVISLKELGFFNSGQAALLPGAAEKIQRIAGVLSQHGLDLRVEGHSDDQPIHNARFRSNWELSTQRAMAVLLLLVDDSGFDPHRISVAGYGQYRPIADNSTPEGRRINRRVDLVVLDRSQLGPQASTVHASR